MGKKLTIYMVDGSATGPKTIEVGNWAGSAVFSPLSALKTMLTRDEFDCPGVYFLASQSESYEFDESIYIGEAEELRSRLKQHIASRDFESVICFLSKGGMLTKAHVKYLESKLIELSREANSSFVENRNNPKLVRLSEADVSDMEYFIEQIRLILPTVGIKALVAAAPHTTKTTESATSEATYKIKSQTLDATMVETKSGFVVKAGSQASLRELQYMADAWCKRKKKLMDAGVLQQAAGTFVFLEDASFPSPSMASSVVLGFPASGLVNWVNASGQTYKEVQEGAASA